MGTVNAQFLNVSADVGIEHISVSPILLGGGAVFIDYNDDGWQDIVVTGGTTKDRVFKNLNGERFEEDLKALPFYRTNLTLTSAIQGLDFNNDGCRDLLISNFSKTESNILLQNDCNGQYINVSESAGITHRAASIGAAIRDINNDGFQDIYIINYIETVGFKRNDQDEVVDYDHQCYADFLYINNGDGTFTEAGSMANVSSGCGLAVAELDFLEDGSLGFYVANDFGESLTPNEVKPYTGSSEMISGLDIGLYAMGVAVGDIDMDQDLDLYITNFGSNALLIRDGTTFTDQAEAYNVENRISTDTLLSVSWGTFFFDMDNDMDQDLFVSNGFIPSSAIVFSGQFDANKLYINDSGTMNDQSEGVGIDDVSIGRGAIKGDYDNDGYIDILVCNINSSDVGSSEFLTYKLYRNVTGDVLDKNYAKVLLEGEDDLDAYGSIATAYVGGLGIKQILMSSGTHASQSEKSLHFGLSDNTIIDSLEVKWSNGLNSTFYNLDANQFYNVSQSTNMVDVLGCMDPAAQNYNATATLDYACIVERGGTSVGNLNDIDLEVFISGNNIVFSGTDKFDDIAAKLYNVLGQEIFRHIIDGDIVRDVGNLPIGVYYLLLEADGKYYSDKFLIGYE